jgi:hypothetical protein
VIPGAYVETTTVHSRKRAALAAHASQQQWLNATQGMDSYIESMEAVSRSTGALSDRFQHAEGWRRHLHFGFCAEHDDPLRDALGDRYLINAQYERSLERGADAGWDDLDASAPIRD